MIANVKGDRSISGSDRPTKNENVSHLNSILNQSERLIEPHLKDLQSSGLTNEAISKTRHFSANAQQAKQLVGCELPGLIFSYFDPDGKPYFCTNGKQFLRMKPDWGDLKTEDSPKYLSPKNNGCRPYFSRLCSDWKKAIKSIRIDIWETEGEKKGDCACMHGLAAIAFSGVDGWQDHSPREQSEKVAKSRVLPELKVVDWKNRKVFQCFDSDIIEKLPVQSALARRAYVLNESSALPYLVLLPNELDGSKNGLDDFVVRHGIKALKELARIAQPTPFQVSSSDEKNGKGSQDKKITLKLDEPDEHSKAVMAWSVLKELWAYRPGIGWYEWQKTHWQLKTQDEFELTLNQFMDAQNWRKRNSGILTSVIRLLRSRLQVRDEQWNPFGKLVFQNGTLDINTREFTPSHNPDDRITRLRPYDFNLSAQCSTWKNFIHEAMEGDEERIKLIQALFRYAVLPRPKDRKAEIEKSFDLFGHKGTGKGTTLDVLTHLVGSENVGSASVDTFKTAVGLGQLLDKDLAIDHDASGFLSNVGVYNKVVSNEPVEVKKLYQDTFTTRLGVLVVRAYNAFIDVPDGSEGLDRRLTIIPFNHQPKMVDTNLSQKLLAELPGIFAWCYALSPEEMKRIILQTGRIKKVLEMSIERFEANNPEYRFLLETFPNGKDSIKAGDLFTKYKAWCTKNEHHPKSQVKFRPAVENLKCKRSSNKNNGCYYYSIPNIADFDIAAHLGIVQGGFEDSYRDSSNPDTEGIRDSCRQFDDISSNADDQGKNEPKQSEKLNIKNLSDQPSTTIPNPLPESISTVSELSLTVSESSSTVSTGFWKVGDRVEVFYMGEWKLGTIQQIPITGNKDPGKNQQFWLIDLDCGLKNLHIWESDYLRLPSSNPS